MKRIVVLSLFLALGIGAINLYAAEDIGKAQEDALNKYVEISENWMTSSGKVQYPDYFGGAYINDNYDLVLYVTEDAEMISPLSNDDGVIVEIVSYSYNELVDMVSDLAERVWGNPDAGLPFTVASIYVYDTENRVVVELEEYTEENVQIFKNLICDSPMLVFQQGYPVLDDFPVEEPSNMDSNGRALLDTKNTFNLGESIASVGATTSKTSIGFRCKKGDVNGFVTACHGNITVGATVHEGENTTNPIGKVTQTQFSGSVDASFVALDKTVTLTNKVGSTSTSLVSNHWVTDLANDTSLYKYGASSLGSSGKVLSTSASYSPSGSSIIISDCYKFSTGSEHGDSGGIVYAYVNGDYVPAGIVNAGTSDGKTTYASKITNIIEAFDVVPY